jgi:hypothetical protein
MQSFGVSVLWYTHVVTIQTVMMYLQSERGDVRGENFDRNLIFIFSQRG